MNSQQKENCIELLDVVPPKDLISMAKTTGKQECTTSEEAVKVILRYTKTPKELLKRQRLKKDTLETYLINKMKKSSRDSLIEITLKLWNEDTNSDDAGALKSSKCVPPPAIASGSGTNGTKRKGDPSPTVDDGKKQLRTELNEKQKSDCEELLNLMQDDELFALAHSATKQTMKDRKEAVKAILKYTTPKKLLEMPKMTKDTLKYYLRYKEVDFDGSAGKTYLVDKVMQVWNQDTSSDAKTTKNSAEASNQKAKATKSAAEAPNPKNQTILETLKQPVDSLVSVRVKLVKVGRVQTVKTRNGAKDVRDGVCGDETATIPFAFWDNLASEPISVGDCVQINNAVLTKTSRGSLKLWSKEKTTIEVLSRNAVKKVRAEL